MSVNLTKFTRSLKIYPSPYPIPSPYVLTTGTQASEGDFCLEIEIVNEQSCESECREIYAENTGDETYANVNYTTCNGVNGSVNLGPGYGTPLGCVSNWYTDEGEVEYYDDGGCGPTPGPATVDWIDCDGNEQGTSIDCDSSENLGCIQYITNISGGECYENELGECATPIPPYYIYSEGSEFVTNGVTIGDIVYVYTSLGDIFLVTEVTYVNNEYLIYTADYVPVDLSFTIYQQSAQSGLGNRGCTLYLPQGYFGGPFEVKSITGTTITSSSFDVSENALFPIQLSHFIQGNGISPTYAFW
jgi:hypothetical protein